MAKKSINWHREHQKNGQKAVFQESARRWILWFYDVWYENWIICHQNIKNEKSGSKIQRKKQQKVENWRNL